MTAPSHAQKTPGLPIIYKSALHRKQELQKEGELSNREKRPSATVVVNNAIQKLQESGERIDDKGDLIRFLLDRTEAVQRGEPGFNLSYLKDAGGEQREVPPDATRVFYGGVVFDPLNPANSDPESILSSREVAEQLAAEQTNAARSVLILEQTGQAATIDQLKLWDDKVQEELEEALEKVIEERPDLASKFTGEDGELDFDLFASYVWKEGLSTQYAREARGDVWVVNGAPFEKQTWFEYERKAMLENGHIKPEDITYVGLTHEPLTAKAAEQGQKSVPLKECTPPMSDPEVMSRIEEYWKRDNQPGLAKAPQAETVDKPTSPDLKTKPPSQHGKWTPRPGQRPEPSQDEGKLPGAPRSEKEAVIVELLKKSKETTQKSEDLLTKLDKPAPVLSDSTSTAAHGYRHGRVRRSSPKR